VIAAIAAPLATQGLSLQSYVKSPGQDFWNKYRSQGDWNPTHRNSLTQFR